MSLELAKRLLHLPPPRALLRALFNGLAKKLATFQSRRVQWPSSRHEGDRPLACPFFLPSEKFDDGGWLHPSRLPLGDGWRGVCTASSQAAPVPVNEHHPPQDPRPVRDSQSEMAEIVLPNDANPLGALLGGRLMHWIDLAGAMAAHRHSRNYVVTASIDHL